LLERICDPISGRVMVHSMSAPSSMNTLLYMHHATLVQQVPTVTPKSIRDNVADGPENEA
jgi:ABC-type phosphate transport system ATPase subunit